MSSFCHLHVHTEYSMLDGAAKLDNMLDKALELEMPGIAMTDHGNMYGAFEFYTKATAKGLKPIIGQEMYLAPGSRLVKKLPEGDRSKGDKYSHMTLLAMSDEGYHNLVKLSSLASIEGYYYKPRIDKELLAKYNKGLIGTTGCVGGEVAQLIYKDKYEEAKKAAGEFLDIFGKENFYVELMKHGIEIEERTFPGLIKLAKELNIPLLATNDSHYVEKKDATAHEALLCIQTGATLDDPKRFRFEKEEFYLKSAKEMRELFRDYPEACDNTLEVCERAEVKIKSGLELLPEFLVPKGESEQSFLRKEVYKGANKRYRDNIPKEKEEQLDFELKIISQMGYDTYFLSTADLIRHAKESGIMVGPGRGSAAGSLVAYCLGITALDPLEHGLFFERFLNPERVSMPDIDIDFDDRRRSEMIEYSVEKYGKERVAQIVTYGSIKAKAALKDAAKVLGYPYSFGEKLSKALPGMVMGKDMPLHGCFEKAYPRYQEATEMRELYKEADYKKIIDTALGLEGLKRQVGVHAAGVILSKDPLTDTIPVWKREADGAIVTQYDMGTCEKIGLLKMDFLGLRNLTVIGDSLKHIKKNHGVEIDLDTLALTDKKTYELLCTSETIGVFQVEGAPMRSLMRAMQPDNFEDISALIALYRPGPMGVGAHIEYVERKHQRRQTDPIHPELKDALSDILKDTYGLCVTGDTLIWDTENNVEVKIESIKERVEKGEFYTVGIDKRGKPVRKRVTKWVQTGKKEVLEIHTLLNGNVRVSKEHPVLTLDGWKKAGDLIVGKDRLASPRGYEKEELKNDKYAYSHASDLIGGNDPFYAEQLWTTITSINKQPQEEMYDITVEEVHNFLANGFIVHNCIYQESVMAIAQKVAGYSLGQADLLRRAMGKKKKEILDKEYIPFQKGMAQNGYSKAATDKLWETLIPFADYAFNKAHSAAYGLITYWTAYLKAHYPQEYMAALLSSVKDDKEKTAVYLHECKRMGIPVLAPDVNESDMDFTPKEGSVRFGLSAVRNVGEPVVRSILRTREEKGNFSSFQEYVKKTESVACNKKAVESLIKAGGFDSLQESRRGLLLASESLLENASKTKKAEAIGQFDLFSTLGEETEKPGMNTVEISKEEWDQKTKLSLEREMLGLYVSGHPLDRVDLSYEHVMPIAELFREEMPDRSEVKLAGVLSNVEHKISKQGKPWGHCTLEDLEGTVEVTFFARAYLEARDILVPDSVVVVAGTLDNKDGAPKILASGIRPPGAMPKKGFDATEHQEMVVELKTENVNKELAFKIKEILGNNAGTLPVQAVLPSGKKFSIPLKTDGLLAVRLQLMKLEEVEKISFG